LLNGNLVKENNNAIVVTSCVLGFVAGSALVLGAALGYFLTIPQRAVAGITTFGSGVLISALSLELMEDAYKRGDFDSTAFGFLAGAIIYTAANWMLSHKGAKHRKRGSGKQPSESEKSGSRRLGSNAQQSQLFAT
jgi:zinc transporter, ZIP family